MGCNDCTLDWPRLGFASPSGVFFMPSEIEITQVLSGPAPCFSPIINRHGSNLMYLPMDWLFNVISTK